MRVRAVAKYVRTSPQKCRLVAAQIRRKSVEKALDILRFSERGAARHLRKTLESAIANAEHNENADIDQLTVREVRVDQGPVLRRWRPRAKGRNTRIRKPTCHITVTVGDGEAATGAK